MPMLEYGSSISYRYNAEGIRTKKTVDGVTTKYFLNGSQILAETKDGSTIWYFYDSEGLRVGLICGGKIYYYMYNLQGDVVGIVRASDGKIAATYKYDAWGKCTVNNIENEDVGTKNPFRYKGYYYDRETDLYYLNSRYYSPAFGRFINADTTDVLGVSRDLYDKNLYAYCDNNPIMRKDVGGEFWTITSGAIIGATISAGMELGMQLVAGGEIDLVSIGFAALGGAASGALAATGLKRIGEMVGNAAIGGVVEVASQIRDGNRNVRSIASNAGKAALIGGVGGFIGKDGIKAKGSAYREGLDNLNSLKGNIKLAISDPKGYKQRLETAINMHQVNSKNAVKKTTARFALASLFSVVADRCSG